MSDPETVVEPAPRPLPRAPRGSIWIGPFVGIPQANRTITATGWLFVAVGGLAVAPALAGGAVGGVFMIVAASIVAAIFILPGAFLLLRRTPLAATIALAISLILLGLSALGLYSMLSLPNAGALFPTAASGGVFFGAIAYLSWRAQAAARFLRPLKDTAIFD